jgi:hypothetical protein
LTFKYHHDTKTLYFIYNISSIGSAIKYSKILKGIKIMKEIAKTNFYTIGIDTAENRLYLKVIGFWNDLSLASN